MIIFPEQLYVKCESSRVKRQWLEGVENAKRLLEQEKNLHRQATIRGWLTIYVDLWTLSSSAKRRKSSSTVPHPNDPRARLQKFSQNNSIIQEQEDDGEPSQRSPSPETSSADKQWLSEVINDLQDVISHRHLDEAVDMLKDWKQCACTDLELNSRFAALEKVVIKMLSDEVRRPGRVEYLARFSVSVV